MSALPASFLGAPIAHRALHDRARGRIENSLSATRAAIEAGYAIEIDLQLSADGEAMVFHDDDLDRLTGESGPVCARSARELAAIPLAGGGGDTIPRLADFLAFVAGRVPLLIELKDQTGCFGPDTGALEQAAATALAGYDGDVAVMSFNPYSVAAFGRFSPEIARGLTTCPVPEDDAPSLSPAAKQALTEISAFDEVGASFISHQWDDLASPAVARLKARAVPVLCWTIRSPEQEAQARRIADNVTFEGYPAPCPA